MVEENPQDSRNPRVTAAQRQQVYKVRSPQFMQNVQKVTQFEPENKCDDCVYMKLELKPIETRTLIPLKTEVNSLELFLTLNFNWQEENIYGGTIRFGIKRGTLKITLTNCRSLIEHRKLGKKLETKIVVDTEIKEVKNNKKLSSLSISLKEFVKGQLGFESQNGKEKTQKFETTKCQVSTKGSPDKPSWDFGVEDDSPCLIGAIEEILATLEVTPNPCTSTIEARFTTFSKHISVEHLDGIVLQNFGQDIRQSQNKRKTLDEVFIKNVVLKSKTQPYLSKQELRHG